MSQPVVHRLAPWVCFWAMFAWCWRVRDLFNRIPDYGDALEVIWGIRYYYTSLFVTHTSPLFTPLVFHPLGWYTATLAHTPLFFLAALPLYIVGGAAFAYNILAIVPSVASFAGVFRFARLFVSRFPATVAALVFTFIYMRWFRVRGHLHILWAISLLPWLAWTLETINRKSDWPMKKAIWRAGLIWGLMINASLYSIFLGGWVLVFLGKKPLHFKNILRVVATAILALVIASPTIVLYWHGSQLSQTHVWPISHNLHWGASLNSLFAPCIKHPLEIIRNIAGFLYSGPYDESGLFNLGITTWLLACIGAWFMATKNNPRSWGVIGLVVGGGIFALGLFLKWNGTVVSFARIEWLNTALWRLGRMLKPEFFVTPLPDANFSMGFPLPALVLATFVPFWESARVLGRYAFLVMLGAVTLGAVALQKSPRVIRYLLAVLWIVEIWPPATSTGVPVDFPLHPAYQWLTLQSLAADEGIVDITYPALSTGGNILIAASEHGKPTVAGLGSFFPELSAWLWERLITDPEILSRPHIGELLQQYRARYLFLHMRAKQGEDMWQMVVGNPALRPIQCFDPAPEVTPWPYRICVAEVLPSVDQLNVFRLAGWSGREDWGIWAEGQVSEAQWIATLQQEYSLKLAAHPFCAPDRYQGMTVKVNGQVLDHHQWRDCAEWEDTLRIPAAMVEVGWNHLTFEYEYALSPAAVTEGKNPDLRLLSVGFTQLKVTE